MAMGFASNRGLNFYLWRLMTPTFKVLLEGRAFFDALPPSGELRSRGFFVATPGLASKKEVRIRTGSEGDRVI
jgi:hypothetical protein